MGANNSPDHLTTYLGSMSSIGSFLLCFKYQITVLSCGLEGLFFSKCISFKFGKYINQNIFQTYFSLPEINDLLNL